METECMQDVFINTLIESWRFAKTYAKILEKLDLRERNKYAGRLTWYMKKLSENAAKAGIKIKEYEAGEPFDTGMAVTTVNLDEFAPEEALVIEQMLEPIIMNREGQILQTGTVLLRRA